MATARWILGRDTGQRDPRALAHDVCVKMEQCTASDPLHTTCRTDTFLLLPSRGLCQLHRYQFEHHTTLGLSLASDSTSKTASAGNRVTGELSITKLGSTPDGLDVLSLGVLNATETSEGAPAPQDISGQLAGGSFIFLQHRSGALQSMHADSGTTPALVAFKHSLVSQLAMQLRKPRKVATSFEYQIMEERAGAPRLMQYSVKSSGQPLPVMPIKTNPNPNPTPDAAPTCQAPTSWSCRRAPWWGRDLPPRCSYLPCGTTWTGPPCT